MLIWNKKYKSNIIEKYYPSQKKVKKDFIDEIRRLKEKEKDNKLTANNKRENNKKNTNNTFKKTKKNKKRLSRKSRQSDKTLDFSNSSNHKMSINVMIQPQINMYNNNIKINGSKNILEKKEDLNELPFSQAIYKDKRNFFQIFMSVIIKKLELVNLILGEDKIKIVLVYQYILSLIVDLFFNTFLYSDEIVSNKYNNLEN